MTAAERIARAHRAQAAYEEFLAPMLAEMKSAYTDRLTEIATTELHPTIRADKITALSTALKIATNLEAGMRETIRDGDLARADKLKAERIEQMTDAQQRLLKVAGV